MSGTKLRDYHSTKESLRYSQAHSPNSSHSLRYVCFLKLNCSLHLAGSLMLLQPTYSNNKCELPPPVCRYIQQLPSLTEQALALSGTSQLQDSLASSTGSDARTVPVFAPQLLHTSPSSSTVTSAPSWLTPQQLQNRHLGELPWNWNVFVQHCSICLQSSLASGWGSDCHTF